MATLKSLYGTSGQAVTMTVASLAAGAVRASAYVDNSSDLFDDILVSLTIKLASGVASQSVYWGAYGTVDNGTTWGGSQFGIDGTNRAITFFDWSDSMGISAGNYQTISTGGGGTLLTFTTGPISLSYFFGYGTANIVPQKWGLWVYNGTTVAFDSTESNHKKLYQGYYAQAV